MDVVWLKKDLRIHDHGPLAEVTRSILANNNNNSNSNKFCILYLFEPDQLSEPTVHGSHICFINESLVDLDKSLSGHSTTSSSNNNPSNSSISSTTNDDSNTRNNHNSNNNKSFLQTSIDITNPNYQTTIQSHTFTNLTICHANAVYTFQQIHHNPSTPPIKRILSHQETSHLKSYSRDKAMKRWCRRHNVQWIEFNQSGVTRCLKDRNDFAKNLNLFLMQPLYSNSCSSCNSSCSSINSDSSPNSSTTTSSTDDQASNNIDANVDDNTNANTDSSTTTTTTATTTYTTIHTNQIIQICQSHLTTNISNLHNRIYHPIQLQSITEIKSPEQRQDRPQRQQFGGESHALHALHTFLKSRGSYYSSGISSPNTSWSSCSRLSPYLTWGCISIRYVVQETRKRQEELRLEKKKNMKKNGKKGNNGGSKRKMNDDKTTTNPSSCTMMTATSTTSSNSNETNSNTNTADAYWLKSLQAFSSRMHWRSHFIQKLESEPSLEKYDLCPAYQHLRRQPNDWNQSYYDAWSTGKTGYPFVDACMRCLLQHGWLNFRMRCMITSFASYNLWLDWNRFSHHLARIFLDYEPGIHYPQIQMQSGTTGINAMRVYNVTKQSKDQDPNGVFIKRYVEELRDVPVEFIHEPYKMSLKLQKKIGVFIGSRDDDFEETNNFFVKNDDDHHHHDENDDDRVYYPKPIVNESQSAKIAKDKIAAVRKLESTKELAEQVYLKHGSRTNREREMGKSKSKASKGKSSSSPSSSPKSKVAKNKDSITSPSNQQQEQHSAKKAKTNNGSVQKSIIDLFANASTNNSFGSSSSKSAITNKVKIKTSKMNENKEKGSSNSTSSGEWNCDACTFLNVKPLALTCSMCGTIRTRK